MDYTETEEALPPEERLFIRKNLLNTLLIGLLIFVVVLGLFFYRLFLFLVSSSLVRTGIVFSLFGIPALGFPINFLYHFLSIQGPRLNIKICYTEF
jgi:hypothetical protein